MMNRKSHAGKNINIGMMRVNWLHTATGKRSLYGTGNNMHNTVQKIIPI